MITIPIPIQTPHAPDGPVFDFLFFQVYLLDLLCAFQPSDRKSSVRFALESEVESLPSQFVREVPIHSKVQLPFSAEGSLLFE